VQEGKVELPIPLKLPGHDIMSVVFVFAALVSSEAASAEVKCQMLPYFVDRRVNYEVCEMV
jgi:hypothetical protein